MKIYTEAITIAISKAADKIFNITTQSKSCHGERAAFVTASSWSLRLHPNSAVIVNDDEPGLLEDLDKWLAEIAPVRDDYSHQGRFESNAAVHFQSLLLQSSGRSFHSPRRASISVRGNSCNSSSSMACVPRRILVKVIGE